MHKEKQIKLFSVFCHFWPWCRKVGKQQN